MANKVTMSPDEFMAKRKAKSPDEFMAEKNISVQETDPRKMSKEEYLRQVRAASPLYNLNASKVEQGSKASLSAASPYINVADLGGKAINAATGSDIVPTNLIEKIYEKKPQLEPKGRFEELVYNDFIPSVTSILPIGKAIQGVGKVSKYVPGLKTVGKFVEKTGKESAKHTLPNIFGSVGASMLPGVVNSDDPFVNLALSLLGSYAGGKVGQKINNKEINELAARLGIKADTPEELITTLLDKGGVKGKAIQTYLQNFPGFGKTRDVINKQSQFVKNKLGIPDKKFDLNVEGFNFGNAASKAAERIEQRSVNRSNALKDITEEIDEIKLNNISDWYKNLRNKFKKQPHILKQFNKDPFIKRTKDLLKSYIIKEPLLSEDGKVLAKLDIKKRNVIPQDTLNEFVKKNRDLIEGSPYGAEFLHNLGIDKELGAAKNLEPTKLSTYQSLLDEASDYFTNVKSVFDKITSVPKELKSSMIKELMKGEGSNPDKFYNLVNQVSKKLNSEEIKPFREAVVMAIGNDSKSNQFNPSMFVERVEGMNNQIKHLIFGNDTKKVMEAVNLIKKLGTQLDPIEINLASSKLYKVIKNVSYLSPVGFLGASALKLISPSLGIGISGIPKLLDILNTNKTLNKAVAKRLLEKQIQKGAPESSGLFDNFYKAISRAAGSRLGKE